MFSCNWNSKPENASLKLVELSLKLENKAFQKIKKKRLEALNKNLLVTGKSDYVEGVFTNEDGKAVKVKVRLKGDHVDHLERDRWSFRVKTLQGKVFGESKFSIQGVFTRAYISEWIFHELLKEADVLRLKYKFVKFNVNDTLEGVYAFESHFTNDLLEWNKVPNGPIIKIDESEFWNFKNPAPFKGNREEYLLQNSPIDVYNEAWCLSTEERTKWMQLAINKLDSFRNGKLDVTQALDTSKWAKYIAINELMQCKHALRWHNLRFYLNPKTHLLEPIGFDCGTWWEKTKGFMNYKADQELFYALMYKNEDFRRLLQKYLIFYSKEPLLRDFFKRHREKINTMEGWMQLEKESFKHWDASYLKSQKRMRYAIDSLRVYKGFWIK